MKKLQNNVITFSFICFCLTLTGCNKEEIVFTDVAPQLKISVVDISDNSVKGAKVTLYNSEEDWESKNNIIQEKITDSEGEALFKELKEIQYFFYVEKDTLNNFYGVVTFSNPVKKNEIKAIKCIIK